MGADLLRIVQADAVDFLRSFGPESVDLVVTDYAYESLEKHRDHGTTTRLAQSAKSSNEWFAIFANRRVPDLLGAVYDVLRPASHAYFLVDDETADVVKSIAQRVGFYVWNTLTWLKTKPGTPPGVFGPVKIGMGYHYRRCTERIVFLEKRTQPAYSPSYVDAMLPSMGDRAEALGRGKAPGKGRGLHDLGIPEVLPCPSVINGYPTEKPVWLLQTLIEQSTELGQLVVDPFAGSGSTGEAALRCGRRAALGDVSPSAIAAMTERLAGRV